jgi:hypothetical protein
MDLCPFALAVRAGLVTVGSFYFSPYSSHRLLLAFAASSCS